MSDKQKPNNGGTIQKPNFPDKTRGQSSSTAPVKPQVPTKAPAAVKPKK